MNSAFSSVEGVESNPKPYHGLPPILNAGSSTEGRDFAARNSKRGVHGRRRSRRRRGDRRGGQGNARDTYGRQVGVFTPAYCVCRETRTEAEELHRWYAEEHADWDAVDNLMTLQGMHAQSFAPEMLSMLRGSSRRTRRLPADRHPR